MEPLRELHLFAGAGGGILGGMLLGHTCVCAVEIEPYCRKVLLQRQRDGILPKFPIWDDVRTFDGKPWRGIVDVVCGGFPCQDISAAGKGAGIDGDRSGLWGDMARIIGEVRPRYAFVENSPVLTSRGLGTVLGDLAELGMDARWGVLGAVHAKAPHRRRRIWIVAYSKLFNGPQSMSQGRGCCGNIRSESERSEDHAAPPRLRSGLWADPDADTINGEGRNNRPAKERSTKDKRPLGLLGDGAFWREVEQPQPLISRVDDGMANRVDRLRAIGNGQVPAVAALAWETLTT